MGFRLVEVYSNPRQIVKEAFAFPNLRLALGLVLAYAIITSLILLGLFSFGFSALSALGFIILEAANWLVFGLIVAFFATLWRGRRHSKEKLKGALTAASFRSLVSLVAVLFMLLVPFAAFPTMGQDVNDLMQGKLSVVAFSDKITQSVNIFSALALLIVLIALVLFVFYYLYLTYLVVWNALEGSVFKTIVMTIVILLVCGLVSGFLSSFFTLF